MYNNMRLQLLSCCLLTLYSPVASDVAVKVDSSPRISEAEGGEHPAMTTTTTTTTTQQHRRVAWIPQEYPDINHNPELCGGTRNSVRFCDPDKILTNEESESVAKVLIDRIVPLQHPCGSGRITTIANSDEKVEANLQIAVALVRKMNLSGMGAEYERNPVTEAAEAFSRQVHNAWGVGEVIKCATGDDVLDAGTGVLIFLSEQDRAIYISRGSALESVLTDRRLDHLINNVMRPILQAKEYGKALEDAIQEITELVYSGEPTTYERFTDFLVTYGALFPIAAIFGFAYWNSRRLERQKLAYARVASHLNELDCARAQALQGKYQATSCPICLEAFEPQDTETTTDENEGDSEQQKMVGSDGLPVKLLRCGHVFDLTCFNEWISSGNKNVDKCPICKADVGGTKQRSGALRANSNSGQDESRREDNDGSTNNNDYGITTTDTPTRNNGGSSSTLRMYNYERNFRLNRIGLRYPQYVQPRQIQRWTDSTYQGSLVRDPSFTESDPSRLATTRGGSRGQIGGQSGGYSNSSSGFGGGSSSGGRGGRW